MKKTKVIEEIILLERLAGGDPHKALRNRRVRCAIKTIRHAWVEEQGRAQSDLHDLLSGTTEWRWPLRVYTPENLKLKEEHMKAELSKNRNLRLSCHEVSGEIPLLKKLIKILKEAFNVNTRSKM